MSKEVSPERITLPTGKKLLVNTGLFINNKFVESVDGKRFETINPATEKPIVAVAEATKRDVDIAVDAAAEAFEKVWKHADGRQRGSLMLKLASLMERDQQELAELEAIDNGKAFTMAKNLDVQMAIQVFQYYAGYADKIHGKTIETNHDRFCYTRHEPIGVCAAVIPWNYPLIMVSWKLGPALACGNTVVLKPSELTPLSALKMGALFREAGFPPGVVNIVPGFGHIAGAALAEHMKVAKITFTGSTAVGRSILKASAESNLKKVGLELGGKSPSIIFADSDLDQAIKWAHMGIFNNQGQNCAAGSRVYVQESIYDEFLKKYKEYVATKPVGDPFSQNTFQGPQVSQLQFDRIMSYIEAGKKEGATLEMGGKRRGTKGYYIEPTIFTDVHEDMKIMREEIFGPVVAVGKFKDEEDAIKKAHATKYGLAAAVFTKDISRAIRMANALQTGSVWINCYNLLENNTPFGGYKESGMGRDLGKYALENYTEVKTVQINMDMKL